MTLDDKPEFVRILNGMAAVKPGGNLTKEGYEMWWASMRDWSIDDFRNAAGHLLKTVEFMPNPYHFNQLKKLQRPSKHEAWAAAMRACLGWRTGASSGDAKIDAAVATIGGYRTLALCDTDKLGFCERRFLDTYEDFVESDDMRAALPHITERETKRIELAKSASASDRHIKTWDNFPIDALRISDKTKLLLKSENIKSVRPLNAI